MKYLALLLISFSTVSYGRAIYGKDNRLDIVLAKNPLHRELGRSVLAMIPDKDITIKNNKVTFSSKTLRGEQALCGKERFHDQQAVATCTAFLVSPKHIVTAGHCVNKISECYNNKWVFDYALKDSNHKKVEVTPSQVYSCKNIVHVTFSNRKKQDWAVVELDREVKDRKPLVLSERGNPMKGDPLFILGFPSGLPLKIAEDATVRSLGKDFFVADLDSFGGNSGSPIINAETNEVEGILVRGTADYKPAFIGICQNVVKCSQNECKGEEASYIDRVLPYIPGRKN